MSGPSTSTPATSGASTSAPAGTFSSVASTSGASAGGAPARGLGSLHAPNFEDMLDDDVIMLPDIKLEPDEEPAGKKIHVLSLFFFTCSPLFSPAAKRARSSSAVTTRFLTPDSVGVLLENVAREQVGLEPEVVDLEVETPESSSRAAPLLAGTSGSGSMMIHSHESSSSNTRRKRKVDDGSNSDSSSDTSMGSATVPDPDTQFAAVLSGGTKKGNF